MAGCTFDYHQAGIGEKGEQCPHEIWGEHKENEFCYFHSPKFGLKNPRENRINLRQIPDEHRADWRGFILTVDDFNRYPYSPPDQLNLQGAEFHQSFSYNGSSRNNLDFGGCTFFEEVRLSNVDLSKTSLEGATFHQLARFENCSGKDGNLSHTTFKGELNLYYQDLSGASFANATFEGNISLKNCNLKGVNFNGCDFQADIDFSKASLDENTQFKGITFQKAVNFAEGTYISIAFEKIEFHGPVDFQKAKLSACSFKHSKFHSTVDFQGADIQDSQFHHTRFGEKATFGPTEARHHPNSPHDEKLRNVDFSNASFGDVRFDAICTRESESEIGKINFHNARFRKDSKAIFSDCLFGAVDFSDVIFHGRVSFNESDFVLQPDFSNCQFKEGIAAVQSVWREPVDLSNRNLPYVNFSGASIGQSIDFSNSTLEDISFEGTHFGTNAELSIDPYEKGTIFSNATLKEARFHKADFGGQTLFDHTRFLGAEGHEQLADFSSTMLVDADFSNAVFETAAVFTEANGGAGNFRDATFQQDAFFDKHTISDTDFSHTQFIGEANFENCSVEKGEFVDAIFRQNVSYKDATFKEIVCIKTIFEGGTSFAGMTSKLTYFHNSFFKEACSFEGASLGEFIFTSITAQKQVDFVTIKAQSLRFLDTVFHGPVGFFNCKIENSHADFSGSIFHHHCLFKGTQFFVNPPGAQIDGEDVFGGTVRFDKAQFHGKLDLEGMLINGDLIGRNMIVNSSFRANEASLSGQLNLSRSKFNERASFHNLSFRGSVNFEKATFKKPVSFAHCCFSKPARFSKATFHKSTAFTQAKFEDHANFQGVVFGEGEFDFSFVSFEKNAELEDLVCNGHLLLRYLHPKLPITFTSNNISQLTYRTHSTDALILFNQLNFSEDTASKGEHQLSFEHQDCSKLGFVNCDLGRVNFLGADIRGTRFDSCRWNETSTYSTICKHYEITESFKNSFETSFESLQKKHAEVKRKHNTLMHSQTTTTNTSELEIIRQELKGVRKQLAVIKPANIALANLELLQSLYLQLLKRYEEERDYQQAGAFHYWEMELRLLKQTFIKKADSGWRKFIGLKVENGLLKFYRLIGDHGENYIKIFLWFIVLQLVIALTLMSTESELGQSFADSLKSWFSGESLGAWGAIGGWFGDLAIKAKLALSTILPTGLTKNPWIAKLRFTSKLILGFGAIGSFALLALFILSIRRRFRR